MWSLVCRARARLTAEGALQLPANAERVGVRRGQVGGEVQGRGGGPGGDPQDAAAVRGRDRGGRVPAAGHPGAPRRALRAPLRARPVLQRVR
eukprot:3338183-Rhodomonas_salina.1